MITQCRSCKSGKLKDILSLGDQYLSHFISEGESKGEKYPLDLVLCEECFLLQLKTTVDSSLLYGEDYGYRSGINNTIKADLAEVASRAMDEGIVKEGDAFLDIGANDGTLLANYPKEYFRVGCEPIKKLAELCKENADVVVNDFFNYEAINKQLPEKKFKIITAISCFYDLDDPNKFVSDIVRLLADDGIFVVQQNYLVGMLQQNAFDNIVHEHLEYYSLLSLEKLLERHGLEVFHVELNDINGGSFRTYIRRKSGKEVGNTVLALRDMESMLSLSSIKIYAAFAERVKNITDEVHMFIENAVADGKTVYVYGASTRGNTLLQAAKMNNRLTKAAVERNPEKWGKKIASIDVPIISEEQARLDKPDYMLVLPWYFGKEFLVREKAYLDAGGKFIFPLPRMEVVGEQGRAS